MVILKLLSKIVKALRSNQSPNQLAWGFVLGMIIGLTPFWNLHNIIIIILIIILNVNISMSIAGFIIFSLFAYIFDPLFHSIGYALLVNAKSLQPLWIYLSQKPVLAFLNFNNTVVLGSFLVSLVLLIPLFYAIRAGVLAYRGHWEERVRRLKVVQALTGSKVYSFYRKLRYLGE